MSDNPCSNEKFNIPYNIPNIKFIRKRVFQYSSEGIEHSVYSIEFILTNGVITEFFTKQEERDKIHAHILDYLG